MYTPRASSSTSPFLLLLPLLFFHSTLPLLSALSSSKWQTLSGNAPIVIARGGFSGMFPDSSSAAYQLAQFTSVSDLVLWCDVQLTKNGTGLCAPDVNLANSTDIRDFYANGSSTYLVNGVPVRGWFSIDFTDEELFPFVPLNQGVYSRTNKFDGNSFAILTPQDVASFKAQGLWLNIQHDVFFTKHNLSMRSCVLSLTRKIVVNYISSPEVVFLKSIASRVNQNVTKLILRFLQPEDLDPSTNQTYRSLSGNLTSIKAFASGILIPKSYIWPVDASNYLQSHTSIVLDAHKAGLEVYASEFYNDVPLSFNFSYDPVTEYLYHIDNGNFSVDGVLSDFPISPSEARDCFSHLGKAAPNQVNLTVISKNGASGDYPSCTDLAYGSAISDGADVIDCPVQFSKDSVPFCMSSINLIGSTKVAQSNYSKLAESIPELMSESGIYTFRLTWSQIQRLTPVISSPQSKFFLFRNPKYRNAGHFMTLSEFLALAINSSSLSGVLINIENAAYLIQKQNIPVTDIVLNALSEAGYANQTSKKVMIQSSDSSVLTTFKGKSNYELMYMVDKNIGDALVSAIDDIKTFAHSVVVSKVSVISQDDLFLKAGTDVVPKLQAANLSVFVQTFSNEFVSQPWDFYSDATVEVNTYVVNFSINGVITDFPHTSARYKRNRCLNLGNNTPSYMTPVQAGSLLQLITPGYLPPSEAPNPTLRLSDVMEPPLPSLTRTTPASVPKSSPGGPTAEAPKSAAVLLLNLAMICTIFFGFLRW